jgi:hypothetical protein
MKSEEWPSTGSGTPVILSEANELPVVRSEGCPCHPECVIGRP